MNSFRLIILDPIINTVDNKLKDGGEPTYIGYEMEKNIQVLHIITNKSIFINNFKMKLDLLYANAPVGVGGQIFNINLFCLKLGL